MDSSVASQIEQWESRDHLILSPTAESCAAGVANVGQHDGETIYEGVTAVGDKVQIHGDRCSCNHERDDSKTDRGTPFGQAWRNRLAASCEHQRAVETARYLGGRCDCGATQHIVHDHTIQYDVTIMRTFECLNCGAPREKPTNLGV